MVVHFNCISFIFIIFIFLFPEFNLPFMKDVIYAMILNLLYIKPLFFCGLIFPVTLACDSGDGTLPREVIMVYNENHFYWEYGGVPVLLLGGTDQDNLFNHPDLPPSGLPDHLDLLVASGGNYVRNTMSHRDEGNIFAFGKANGKFDLETWNEDYWLLFDNFLRMTEERDIIVQLEIWETWDFYVDRLEQGGWSKHPFNPLNNINYTAGESGLSEKIDFNPVHRTTTHNFFHTVPALENNKVVLSWQHAFVDKILSLSLDYPHVLYCMNNETGEPPEWGEYWVTYIRSRAKERGLTVHATDMRRSEDLSSADHRIIQDKPEIYTFLEISQNNGQSRTGQDHYDQIAGLRDYISDNPRPMNNVKVYGSEDGFGGADEAVRKFWRNIFSGSAAVRFHRRTHHGAGLGLGELAQIHLRGARDVTDELNVFTCEPRNDLLSDRLPDSAYCLAVPGDRYAVFFTGPGSVSLDISASENTLSIRWYDILNNSWSGYEAIENEGMVTLCTPGGGSWVALIISTP
jgi:hypothetical protein